MLYLMQYYWACTMFGLFSQEKYLENFQVKVMYFFKNQGKKITHCYFDFYFFWQWMIICISFNLSFIFFMYRSSGMFILRDLISHFSGQFYLFFQLLCKKLYYGIFKTCILPLLQHLLKCGSSGLLSRRGSGVF